MRWYFCLAFLCQFSLKSTQLIFSPISINQNERTSFTVKFELLPGEYIYHDKLNISCNSPAYILSSWQTREQPEELFDTNYRKTKKILNKNFTIIGQLTKIKNDPHAQVVVQYESNQTSGPQFSFFAIEKKTQTAPQAVHEESSANQMLTPSATSSIKTSPQEPISCPAPHAQPSTASSYIQTLIASTDSWFIRLLLVMLLGILMSLTPCIYPMIPITIGILHGTRRTTWWYQGARALCYMLGVALMFAILGFVAALTGSLFGSFLQKPLVIIAIVVFLLYLAFSMFGWYEMYMPRFFTVRKKDVQPSGSCLSAFVFGFASGTIASPCLSPGLAFLLSIVTALGNKFFGFILLFAFGIGMSIPLLLIGTFAPIINYLPHAGRWMTEIKKFFGILLITLSFYFMSMIVPMVIVWWLIATSLTAVGVYYLVASYQRRKYTRFIRIIRMSLALALLACAGVLYWHALHLTRTTHANHLIQWQTNYQTALKQAQENHKWVFIDIGAPYCSICKAIDRCIFNDSSIAPLINTMIPIYIDANSSTDYQAINEQYHIIGVPTILIINPYNKSAQKRLGAELYTTEKDVIIQLLQDLINQPPTN